MCLPANSSVYLLMNHFSKTTCVYSYSQSMIQFSALPALGVHTLKQQHMKALCI